MEINRLSCQEICEIITVSAKSGVSKLKFGSLFLEFGKQTETHPESHQSDKLGNASTPDAEMLEKARQHSQEQSMVENELQVREERIAMLYIEDPLKAEEMLRDEELEDDDDEFDEFAESKHNDQSEQ